MKDDATCSSFCESRGASLAFASVAVWLAAAVSSGHLGIWVAIGGAAVVLGVAVLVFDRPAAAALLQPTPRLLLLGAIAGYMMAAATSLLYPPLARLLPFIATDTERLYAALRAPSLAVAALATESHTHPGCARTVERSGSALPATRHRMIKKGAPHASRRY
jgi:hypothetical protein